MTTVAVFITTFGYIGYFPVARGTVGAAAGLLLHLALERAGWPYAHAVAIVALFVAGVWSGTIAERHFGKTDPGHGVIDEVVGMLMTLFALPVGWVGLVAGFVLFRIFDILKPFPARRFEDLPGGLGMMADDAVAGIYSYVMLRALWTWGMV